MDMLAQRIHRFGGPEVIELDSIDLPRPGPGEVLLKVVAAGVGPWDALIRTGNSGIPQPLPLTLGADVAGEVLDVGHDAGHLSAGVHVYGVTNPRFTGGYATHAIVDANRVARKPPAISFVEAAGIPIVAVTAWKALFEQGGLQSGQRVLIHGAAGNVGDLAVQMARDAGAVVIALGSAEDYERPFEKDLDPVDLVIDTIGGDVQTRSLSTLKKGGALISIVNPPDLERARGLGVRAEFFIVDVTTPDIERISQLLASGVIRPSVADVLSFTEAREAHVRLGQRHSNRHGKIILTMET